MSNNDTDKKLTEDEARKELVKLAADNDIYFVVWSGHWSNYFVGLRNNSRKQPEIYGAMYEQFYDVVKGDLILFKLSIGWEFTWQELLRVAKTAIETKQSLIKEIETIVAKEK